MQLVPICKSGEERMWNLLSVGVYDMCMVAAFQEETLIRPVWQCKVLSHQWLGVKIRKTLTRCSFACTSATTVLRWYQLILVVANTRVTR